MKKYQIAMLLAALCICMVGCKSNDYQKAVDFQRNRDYSSAYDLFTSLGDYKDSAANAAVCQEMITAIDKFDSALDFIASKDAELDTAISNAAALVSEHNPTLDNTLSPAVETAISACKAAKVEIPDMPSNAADITALAEKLMTTDYGAVIDDLSAKVEALETGIRQYDLVNAPSEAYIIDCLMRISGITGISAATEDNDPNGQLHKAGGYNAQVYFSSELIDQASVIGDTIIEKGTECGGSVEVYATVEDAQKRNDYLTTFDGSVVSSGSHAVIGTVIVRTSDKLTASQQKELESNIIAALISLEK